MLAGVCLAVTALVACEPERPRKPLEVEALFTPIADNSAVGISDDGTSLAWVDGYYNGHNLKVTDSDTATTGSPLVQTMQAPGSPTMFDPDLSGPGTSVVSDAELCGGNYSPVG